jgi:hypothetical protein
MINGINDSKVFLFIWNKGYSESENCMREFSWVVSKGEGKIKIMALELEKIDDVLILFNLRKGINLIRKFTNMELLNFHRFQK